MTANRYRYQNPAVLGTVVDFSFDVVGPAADEVAERVGNFLLGTVERLQDVFSAFEPASELSRWRRGELTGEETSHEFASLMAEVLWWHRHSGGLFNPLSGELSALWAEAEIEGREPDPGRLLAVAESIVEPRFRMVDGHPEPTGDCSAFNVNAMAKGYIVDRAMTLTVERFAGIDTIDDLLVNAGGDLCHRGRGMARVGIENPLRPYDNEPPLTIIEIANEAVATSGGGRRGYRIGDRRHSHVLDPRTGRPTEASASASIVAPSAMIADVAATPAGILPPAEAVDFLDQLDSTAGVVVAGLIVDCDGRRHTTRRWRDRFGPSLGVDDSI